MHIEIFRAVIRKVTGGCTECSRLITDSPESADDATYRLITNKDRGGLLYPSRWLRKAVDATERAVRHHHKTSAKPIQATAAHLTVLNDIGGPPPEFVQHANETQYLISNHYYILLKNVVNYITAMKSYHRANQLNNSIHKRQVRHKNTKLVHFLGQ